MFLKLPSSIHRNLVFYSPLSSIVDQDHNFQKRLAGYVNIQDWLVELSRNSMSDLVCAFSCLFSFGTCVSAFVLGKQKDKY